MKSDMLFPRIRDVSKLWGWEEHLKNDDAFCVKILGVNQGCSCSIHWHVEKSEMFVMKRGKMLVEVWDRLPEDYSNSDVMRLLKHHPQRFILEEDGNLNTGHIMIATRVPHRFTGLSDEAAMFVECSTFDSPDDSYRAIESICVEE